MAVKITEDSVKANKLKQELEDKPDSTSRAIGFMISNEEEDDNEYEDE